jgi:hypothetical protein
VSKDENMGSKIIRALHATGPVKQEALWMIADNICKEISALKSCLITHRPEFCMVQLHELQEQAYRLRNHLTRETPAPTE